MRRALAVAAWAVVAATVVRAGTVDGGEPVRYDLQPGSSYEQGCFEPCLCPVLQIPISGTFTLTLDHADPLFAYYTVSDIDWRGEGATGLHVTGSGTYRIGGEVAIMQQLALDLSINGEAPEHYDSGTIVGGGGFPAIEIAVSQNQMFCYDTVFHIIAWPASPPGGVLYRLMDKSTYQQGCFYLCDCAVWEPVPMAGMFRLVPQSFDASFHNYSVADVKFTSRLGDQDIVLTGSGTYRIGGEAAIMQQMRLDLSVNGGDVQHFDSGLVPGGSGFPAIDTLVSTDTHCFDIRLDIHARPAPPIPYHLTKTSMFQEGCFEGCACPITLPVPMRGTFGLVRESFDGLFDNYAVADVKFTSRLGDQDIVLTGSGQYRVGGEFAAMHQLELDLSKNGGEAQHFDSGLIVGGTGFPAIDILVSTNTGCYDIRLDLHARLAGDFDLDGDVDQADFAVFKSCARGPEAGPDVLLASPVCTICDLDGDNDVDQTDFAIMQRCLSGEDIPANPNCAD